MLLLWNTTEVGTANSVAAFRPFPDASLGDVLVSDVEKYVQILIWLPVRYRRSASEQ